MSYPGRNTGNGVPSQYTEIVSVSFTKHIIKGQLNKLKNRLATQTESQESSGTLIGSVISDRLYHGVVTAGPFQVGEVITGGTSLAVGSIVAVNKFNLVYSITSGTFLVGEIITGGISGATVALTAIDIASNFGQVIKIPQDNVSGLALTVESNPLSLVIDDFEASELTLQAAWVTAGVPVKISTSHFTSGAQGLLLDQSTNQNLYTYNPTILSFSISSGNYVLSETITGGTSGATAIISLVGKDKLHLVSVVGVFVNGEIISGSVSGVTSTVSSVANTLDFSNANSLDFDMFLSAKPSQQLEMTVTDGINSSIQVFTGIDLAFTSQSVNLGLLAALGVPGPVDLTAVSAISFQPINKAKVGYFIVIDNIRVVNDPGSIGLRFYDLGPTIPVSGVTTLSSGTPKNLGDLNFDGGSQPLIVHPLGGGKEVVSIASFSHGAAKEEPSNTLLTPNNYYAVTCEYIDSNVNIYGANPNNAIDYYPNGFAFTYSDIISPIISIGPNYDSMFILKSALNVWVKKVSVKLNAFADGAHYIVAVENEVMHLRIISEGFLMKDCLEIDLSENPIFMPEGGKIEVYFSDVYTSKVTEAFVNVEYWALKKNLY